MAQYYYAVYYDSDTERWSIDIDTGDAILADGSIWDENEWHLWSDETYEKPHFQAAAILERALTELNGRNK